MCALALFGHQPCLLLLLLLPFSFAVLIVLHKNSIGICTCVALPPLMWWHSSVGVKRAYMFTFSIDAVCILALLRHKKFGHMLHCMQACQLALLAESCQDHVQR